MKYLLHLEGRRHISILHPEWSKRMSGLSSLNFKAESPPLTLNLIRPSLF